MSGEDSDENDAPLQQMPEMLNPFERFGIKHLSASSLNSFREQPAVWVVQYLMKMRGEAGPAAWRGQAVEAGLDLLLFQPNTTMEQAIAASQKKWDELAMGDASDKAIKEYDDIPGYLEQAQLAIKSLPPIMTRQSKISILLDGIEIPVIGYTDYMFADFGIDLKTTNRMPTEARQSHVDQMAIYMKAKKKPFKLLYVTPKKWSLKEVSADMAAASMKRVTMGAHSIRHLLAKSLDPSDALNFYSPDFTSFYWSPPLIEAAQKVYDEHQKGFAS
ncbi:PD-(D/E)XK nuclease superfamily [uncultured Caudovirales phage]|uniref:PD-(D/E)XK nuclease superfamily n=1 Tax=uncultured Caudovirales phage TaxID=2100421 RepID=A0A6J5RRV2_9CAUD|nr:PD-(D/E)XK nuclease superfamily [uncultured Caudovirales phage]